MSAHCTTLLICPVCGDQLFDAGRSARCVARHSYDRARSGYLNLLPAGHGHSALRGDTRVMLIARQRFLQRGHFQRLSDQIVEIARTVFDHRSTTAGLALADAGCGVGYYLGRLTEELRRVEHRSLCSFGFDIAPEAVRLAATQYRDVQFVVNDIKHQLCLATGSIDLLLNIFAPRNPEEFARVLHPSGSLLVIVPGEKHLVELRERLPLLSAAPDKVDRTVDQLGSAFAIAAKHELTYPLELQTADVLDLLQMTPNYWHVDAEILQQAATLGNVTVTMSFVLIRAVRS